MKRTKAKKPKSTKTIFPAVAVRSADGELVMFEFPDQKQAFKFIAEVEAHGCKTLLGWGKQS